MNVLLDLIASAKLPFIKHIFIKNPKPRTLFFKTLTRNHKSRPLLIKPYT